MSRRHRENEIEDNYRTNSVESRADDNPNTHLSALKFMDSILFKSKTSFGSSFSKLLDEITIAALFESKIEIDDEWVKIRRDVFTEEVQKYFRKYANQETEEEPPKKKKGRNPIKRLFKKVADSKVVRFFHDTLDEVKEKCAELYNDMSQYCVCFLHGIHRAFAPDEDPYGKISHYYEMLKDVVVDLPSRRTIAYYNNWYENWRPIIYNEQPKEKNERHKHGIWQQLIEWIYYYLQKIAPEYAVQMQRG